MMFHRALQCMCSTSSSCQRRHNTNKIKMLDTSSDTKAKLNWGLRSFFYSFGTFDIGLFYTWYRNINTFVYNRGNGSTFFSVSVSNMNKPLLHSDRFGCTERSLCTHWSRQARRKPLRFHRSGRRDGRCCRKLVNNVCLHICQTAKVSQILWWVLRTFNTASTQKPCSKCDSAGLGREKFDSSLSASGTNRSPLNVFSCCWAKLNLISPFDTQLLWDITTAQL